MNSCRFIQHSDILLPKRDIHSHKGDCGHVLIIGGSVGFTGAPVLAANGALRSGGGLITLCVPDKAYPILAPKCLEVMPVPCSSDEKGLLSPDAFAQIGPYLEKADAVLFGPGLGRNESIRRLLKKIIRNCRVPLVIDADGINALEGHMDILDEAKGPLLFTPHEVEFARLGGERQALGRVESARKFAIEHHCSVALKGHGTVCAFADGSCYVNRTGNPGMAKGGSGDVLAGMLVGFLGQGFGLQKSLLAAVYLHGLAGDICCKKFGELYFTPSDVTEHLYLALKSVTR